MSSPVSGQMVSTQFPIISTAMLWKVLFLCFVMAAMVGQYDISKCCYYFFLFCFYYVIILKASTSLQSVILLPQPPEQLR